MKLIPSKSKPGAPNPFAAAVERGTQPVGPGIGTARDVPGLGKPKSAKRNRPASQTLGETPQRDGPFAPMAAPIATAFPPKTRVNQARRKESGLNPFRTDR
jgi:hypothetical protein